MLTSNFLNIAGGRAKEHIDLLGDSSVPLAIRLAELIISLLGPGDCCAKSLRDIVLHIPG
jgi:hypothetical protein